MPRPKQTEAQLEAMRERILDAAQQVLREEGPNALSIRAIAEQVGVSHMALYTYYENREALMAALGQRHRERIRVRQSEMLAQAMAGDVVEVMRQSLGIYAQMAQSIPRIYQFLWVQPLVQAAYGSHQRERLADDLQHLARLVALGIERHAFAPRDPLLAAGLALSIVNAPHILYHSGRLADAALYDHMAQEALGAAINYLCDGPPRPAPAAPSPSCTGSAISDPPPATLFEE